MKKKQGNQRLAQLRPTPGSGMNPRLWSAEEGEHRIKRERERKKKRLAGRFCKAVTFPMMGAFPITALTLDPGR